MEFAYTAVNAQGVKQKGLLEANNEGEVAEFLLKSGLSPLVIKKTQKETLTASLFFKKVTSSDIVLFTRQLSSMIATGLTLIESLNILKQQATRAQMKNVINDLIGNISEGHSFSQALSNHKDIFSEVYIALIQAAETGGLLNKVLERLADNLERSENLRKRVRSAMFYPAIVITGVIAVVAIMNIFVIPQLGTLYKNLNLNLPLTTRIVLGISKLFTVASPLVLVGSIAMFFLYRRFKRTQAGARAIDKTKLKLPIFGGIITLSILDEVTRTLSLLIGSGSSILEALQVTANVANNIWYTEAVRNSGILVEKGIPLSTAFAQQNIFPHIMIQMTKVGESTGRIDESLLKVSEYFERDLDIRVKTLTTSIEPILIIVLGITVAFLILSVITPIYSLISQIQ